MLAATSATVVNRYFCFKIVTWRKLRKWRMDSVQCRALISNLGDVRPVRQQINLTLSKRLMHYQSLKLSNPYSKMLLQNKVAIGMFASHIRIIGIILLLSYGYKVCGVECMLVFAHWIAFSFDGGQDFLMVSCHLRKCFLYATNIKLKEIIFEWYEYCSM